MTVEQSVLVSVPRSAIGDLLRDIVSAARRAEKADPGDRSDVVRYEGLSVRLEALAERAIADGAEHVVLPSPLPSGPGFSFEDSLVDGDVGRLGARLTGDVAQTVKKWAKHAAVIELRRGCEIGATTLTSEAHPAPEPAESWPAEDDVSQSRAVERRFRAQFETMVAMEADRLHTRGDAINPSGINNRIITQTLREFVMGDSGGRVDVPVVYRDGSRASHAFPLRCLTLVDNLPDVVPDLELHLALLSIRHTEMDPVIDGAWLRNAEVSRPRPAALTDDFVYETSRTQLRYITEDGQRAILLHIYQTGLDTAVVGFYRAVVDHLLERPFSLSVVPMFYATPRRDHPITQEASFRSGLPWTLGKNS